MKSNRRKFLKLAGLSFMGWASLRAWNVLAAIGKNQNNKRWAMVIRLGKCRTDCRDCIDACHRVHNVPQFPDQKDEVKWIWTERFESVFPSQEHRYMQETARKAPVIVLCNQCENPPCVRVCPTKATFRRDDGIVMMDYHRCIGCRFCVAGCPYGARSMNFRDPRPFIPVTNPEFPTRTKGVVEKCNFCMERLSSGLIPACVQACQEKALVFGDLENRHSEVRQIVQSHFTIRRKAELGTGPQVYYLP